MSDQAELSCPSSMAVGDETEFVDSTVLYVSRSELRRPQPEVKNDAI